MPKQTIEIDVPEGYEHIIYYTNDTYYPQVHIRIRKKQPQFEGGSMDKYHVGFIDTITNGNGDKEEVVRICESQTGKLVAYARSAEMAKKIIDALDHDN